MGLKCRLRVEVVESYGDRRLDPARREMQARIGPTHGEENVRGQLVGAEIPLRARERMVAMRDEARPYRRESNRAEVSGGRGQHRDHQVGIGGDERALDAGEELRRDVDAGARPGLRDRERDVEDRRHREDPVEHELERRLPAGADLGAGIGELTLGREELPGVNEDTLAGRGQARSVAPAVEEGEVGLLLERLDGVEHGGVPLVERRRSPSKGAVLREGLERASLIEGDRHDVHCSPFEQCSKFFVLSVARARP